MKAAILSATLLFAALAGFSSAVPGARAAEEKPRVAVLTLETHDSIEEAEGIAEELRQAFVNSHRYIVVDRTLTQKIAEEWATQQSGLTEGQKAVQVGKLYNVQLIITGKLNKFTGGGWQVSAVIIDAQSGITKRAETVRHRGDFFSLLDQKVPLLAHTLLTDDAPRTPSRAPATAPAVVAAAKPPPPAPPTPPPPGGFAGKWSEKAPVPTPRRRHAAAVYQGRIFVFGGESTSDKPLASVEAYDPGLNAWSPAAPMPRPLSEATAASLGARIYLFGGRDGKTYASQVLIYDPAANAWSSGTELPEPRVGATAVALGGRVYLLGGEDRDKHFLARVDAYDPVRNTWSARAALPHARAFATAQAVNGKIYLVGGRGATGAFGMVSSLAYLDIYDPDANQWSTGPNLPGGRAELSSALLGAKLFVFGGTTGSMLMGGAYGLYNVLEVNAVTWSRKTAYMLHTRTGHTSNVVNGRIYLIGGEPGREASVTELR